MKIGEYRVEVKDNEERVGVVDVLIPEPTVSVTPDSKPPRQHGYRRR